MSEHRPRILHEVIVLQLVRKIGDRAAFVGLGDAEQLGDAFGEALDAQAGVEKKRGEIGCRNQVLQIAVRARDRFQLQLQLSVDNPQFLVNRVQLLLAGCQLL